jgi:hypothetical protein
MLQGEVMGMLLARHRRVAVVDKVESELDVEYLVEAVVEIDEDIAGDTEDTDEDGEDAE